MNQPTLNFDANEHTQEGRVLALLRSMHVVSNADLQAAGLALIGRNRISNLRAKGYVIAQKGAGQGDDWMKNAYRLVWYPGEVPDKMVEERLRMDGWWIRPEEWKGKGRRQLFK